MTCLICVAALLTAALVGHSSQAQSPAVGEPAVAYTDSQVELKMDGWTFQTPPQFAQATPQEGFLRFQLTVSEKGEVLTCKKVAGQVTLQGAMVSGREEQERARLALQKILLVRTKPGEGGQTGYVTWTLRGKRDPFKLPEKAQRSLDSLRQTLAEPSGWAWDHTPRVEAVDNEAGIVTLKISFDSQGKVTSVSDVGSTMSARQVQLCMDAVRQRGTFRRTKPGNNGATAVYTYRFRVE